MKQHFVKRDRLVTESIFKERAEISDMAMRNFKRMGIIEPWVFKDHGSCACYFSAKTADRIRLMQTYLLGADGAVKNLMEAYTKACEEIE